MNLLSDFKVTQIVNIDIFFHSKFLPIRTQAHWKSRYIFPPLAQIDPFSFPTFFLYLFQVAVLFIDPIHADISNFDLLRNFQLKISPPRNDSPKLKTPWCSQNPCLFQVFLELLSNTVLSAPVNWTSSFAFLIPNSLSNACYLHSIILLRLKSIDTFSGDLKWITWDSPSGTISVYKVWISRMQVVM